MMYETVIMNHAKSFHEPPSIIIIIRLNEKAEVNQTIHQTSQRSFSLKHMSVWVQARNHQVMEQTSGSGQTVFPISWYCA